MAKQSTAQKDTVERVMHEFKTGELESGSGAKVKSRKQAIAIALDEAGASRSKSSADNKRTLARTKRRERTSERSKAELYAEAKSKGIAGRSKMSKAELVRAIA